MAMIVSDAPYAFSAQVLNRGIKYRKYIYMNNKLKVERRKKSKENHISNPNRPSPHGHP